MRTPYAPPTLELRRKPPSVFEYEYDDFQILNYQAHPGIRAPIAV
jgi:thymidylate synthase